MKLTRNEIATLVSYYNGLQLDLKDQIEILNENCQGAIDFDLYKIQLDRYKTEYNEYETRLNELRAERDNL